MFSEKYNLTSDQARVLVAVANGSVLEQADGGHWLLNGERLEYRSTADRFANKTKPRLTHLSYDDWEMVEPEDDEDSGRRYIARTLPKVVLTDLGRMAAAEVMSQMEASRD